MAMYGLNFTSIYAAGVNYQFYLYYRLDAPLFTELAAVCMLHVYIFSIFTHRHCPKLYHTNENTFFLKIDHIFIGIIANFQTDLKDGYHLTR